MTSPPLIVHLVAEPGGSADVLAATLLEDLTGDPNQPLARGLGIPVRLLSPTQTPNLDGVRNLVVALIDDEFLAAGHAAQLSTLVSPATAGFRFVPVALTPLVMKQALVSAGPSWVPSYLDIADGADPSQRVVVAVAHAACKLLVDDETRIRVFVSHAKADSVDIVNHLRAALDETQLGEFFDARDIPFGDDFGDVIVGSIKSCAVVAVLSDLYPTREWCRIEALEATRGKVPVVVVDALVRGRHRALPYLGGATVVRWRDDQPRAAAQEAVRWIALEMLRTRNFTRRADALAATQPPASIAGVLPYAPELLTIRSVASERDSGILLYPDPPLGTYELTALQSSLGGLEPRTPTQLIALGSARSPLDDHLVALSVSEPAAEELAGNSLRPFHVTRAFVEIARHLLAAGASLAYGGNLAAHRDQDRNFLELLLDLVAAYDLPGRPDRDRIRNYQGQADLAVLDTRQRAWINAVATLVPVDNAGADVPSELTKMRSTMTSECDARVVLGGKLLGFSGLLPGIAEEALQALHAAKPLFVLGGFGGAARALRDVLLGGDAPELTVEFQQRRSPSVAHAVGESQSSRRAVEHLYAAIASDLRAAGPAGLKNGLSDEDNETLLQSDDVELCASLVLRGLVASLQAS